MVGDQRSVNLELARANCLPFTHVQRAHVVDDDGTAQTMILALEDVRQESRLTAAEKPAEKGDGEALVFGRNGHACGATVMKVLMEEKKTVSSFEGSGAFAIHPKGNLLGSP